MNKQSAVEFGDSNAWPFVVREVAGNGQETTHYEASLPFRQVYCMGSTRDAAIGSLMACYADLVRRGALDPRRPERIGLCAIQHAIEILEEALATEIGHRGVIVELSQREDMPGKPSGAAELHNLPNFARRNEVISGIATAIAALARVKEL